MPSDDYADHSDCCKMLADYEKCTKELESKNESLLKRISELEDINIKNDVNRFSLLVKRIASLESKITELRELIRKKDEALSLIQQKILHDVGLKVCNEYDRYFEALSLKESE